MAHSARLNQDPSLTICIFYFLNIFFNCSFDGGNGKLIVSLTVVDMDNPNDDGSHFRCNGRRQALVVARADYCPENLYNWEIILSKLKIFNKNHFWRPFIITGDCKVMNAFTGL